MILPLLPIMCSSRPAIDGLGILAIISRGKIPSDNTVIATYKIKAITIPNTVANPTSLRFWRERITPLLLQPQRIPRA